MDVLRSMFSSVLELTHAHAFDEAFVEVVLVAVSMLRSSYEQ